MTTRQARLELLALEAIDIYARQEEAAAMDAGFDAGEFSGPAHARMADDRVARLATDNGFTPEELNTAVNALTHELLDDAYGPNAVRPPQ
jgi:hypothetical protein